MKNTIYALIILVTTSTLSYAGNCPKKAVLNGIIYEVQSCIVIK